ncbi:hypothetical protein CLORY_19100 [Clostridium oryzae]|uniref:Uncharacterized protein n=1 Tax=Clostridium oryzae TaxID=1450648 RepID=A0A1V4IR71_9CLOT|nr:hypothetical protein CLORY_19100 [Clostridium oryzae]
MILVHVEAERNIKSAAGKALKNNVKAEISIEISAF